MSPHKEYVILTNREVRDLASKSRPTLQLFDEMVSWYGDSLTFSRQPEGESFVLPDIDEFGAVRLTLGVVVDGRAVAAIAHECLHLQLLTKGNPMPVFQVFAGESDNDRIKRHICFTAHGETGNWVGHATFIEQFRSMGFRDDEFLKSNAHADPADLRRTLEKDRTNSILAGFERGRWNKHYLCELLLSRMGFDNCLSATFRHGQEMFATMGADALLIQRWFDSGNFRDPKKFATTMNVLLRAIGFGEAQYGCLDRYSGGFHLIEPP